jgi:energy-coupling factor transporter ATP-binding protein EcfA2
MKIIALKGKNGSGKSTVAAMLAKKLDEKGISNKVLSFAEPLKKIVDKAFFPKKSPLNWENRDEKEVGRNLLETTADAIKSAFSTNVFAEELVKKIKDYDFQVSTGDIWETKPSFVIVSDLRFDSEHFALANCIDNDCEDELIVVEITNPLTDNNLSEYDLDLIKANKTLIFGKDIEVQLDSLIKEIL